MIILLIGGESLSSVEKIRRSVLMTSANMPWAKTVDEALNYCTVSYAQMNTVVFLGQVLNEETSGVRLLKTYELPKLVRERLSGLGREVRIFTSFPEADHNKLLLRGGCDEIVPLARLSSRLKKGD